MADYNDIATRIAVNSEILRVYPNAVVTILETGTSNVVDEVSADENGNWEIATLDTGIYDISIDGAVRATFHFVRADHKHLPDESWTFFKSGSITADQDEVNTMPVYGSDVAGEIIKIMITAQSVDATGDVTVHVLKGASGGGSILTVASDSEWNHQISPGAKKRYLYVDNNPGIDVAINEAVTIGLDWVANAIEGINVLVVFRPTATYPT